VHNGIEVSDLSPAAEPPRVPTIGYLARMSHGKGLGTLIDAYTLLRRDPAMGKVKLRVGGAMTAGDRPYIKGLRAQLLEEGLEGDVSFEANLTRREKIELLRAINVLSVPATYGESFGLYVIEAWACGVPVVQPDSGAFGELLAAGGGGILCQADDAASLAGGVKRLLNDPVEARRLGERGRQAVAERFTAEAMAAGVFDVLHFANFFRYMEAAEHAFFRSIGLSVHGEFEGRTIGWPRVEAACSFTRPLRFEDTVQVHMLVREKRAKALRCEYIFRKIDGGAATEVARGKMTLVCAELDEAARSMKAIEIPPAINALIDVAPPEETED